MSQHAHWAAWAEASGGGQRGVVDLATRGAAERVTAVLWREAPGAWSYRDEMRRRLAPESDPDAPWPLPWERAEAVQADAKAAWFLEDASGSLPVQLPAGEGGPPWPFCAVVTCTLVPCPTGQGAGVCRAEALARRPFLPPEGPAEAEAEAEATLVVPGAALLDEGHAGRLRALAGTVAAAPEGVRRVVVVGDILRDGRPLLAPRRATETQTQPRPRLRLAELAAAIGTGRRVALVPGAGDPVLSSPPVAVPTPGADPRETALPRWMVPPGVESLPGPAAEVARGVWVCSAAGAMACARSTSAELVAAVGERMLQWGVGLPASAAVSELVLVGCDGDAPVRRGAVVAVPRGCGYSFGCPCTA